MLHRSSLFALLALLLALPACGGTSKHSASADLEAEPAIDDPFASRCINGKMADCYEVARELQTPEADPVLRVQLGRRFTDGCEHSVPEDCFRAALFAETPDQMISLMERSCSGGFGEACRNLGDLFVQHESSAELVAQTVTFYSKGCDFGDARSCVLLGQCYERGGAGLARDMRQAEASYKKGCDLHDKASCRAHDDLGCREGRMDQCSGATVVQASESLR
jgi:hypothetical protein